MAGTGHRIAIVSIALMPASQILISPLLGNWLLSDSNILMMPFIRSWSELLARRRLRVQLDG